MSKFRDDKDWDYMSAVPAKTDWSDPIEALMAGPFQVSEETLSEPLANAIRDGIAQLDERDRFIIESIYVWGHSYATLAEMMGWASKSTAHKYVGFAQDKLKEILLEMPAIKQLLGDNDDDLEQ
jgi:DNA-directed RNA polymerase specialized sigma24 family protein